MSPKSFSNSQPASTTSVRSDGPLSPEDVATYRAEGRALAYDPVQIGWVPADCVDDIDMMFKPTKGPRYAKLRADAEHTYALRQWRTADVIAYHRMLDDPLVWQHMPEPYPNPLSLEDAANLLDLSIGSNHHEVHAVIHKGRAIGQVRLEFNDETEGAAELSYWLGRDHWRQGHGRSVVKHFVKRSFDTHPQLTALTARIRPQNAASRRVLDAAGFVDDPSRTTADWVWMRVAR